MEFEDLQRIWDEQKNESLYAINEEALHKRIAKSRRSIEFGLNMLEWGVIGSSLISLFALYLNWVGDPIPLGYHLIPVMLLVISTHVFLLRRQRQRQIDEYPPTMVGELDKAIAQNDFLVKRIQTAVWWYMLPVFGGFTFYFYYEKGPYWWQSVLAMIGCGVLSYCGVLWELRKFHLPKKQDLQALHKLLSQSE